MDPDFNLLARWQQGDLEAGDQLVQRHFQSVYRFFRGKAGGEADDLIQETFASVTKARHQVRTDSFRAYLFSVARNCLYDWLRKKARRPAEATFDRISLADLGTSPSGEILKKQHAQLLMEALQRLPVEQQLALELSYWEGLSGQEIATVLGIPANTVRSRLARGREALRKDLATSTASVEARESSLRLLEDRDDPRN